MMANAKPREVRKKCKLEFTRLDDLADACVFMMEKGIGDGPYNVGTGTDVTIREAAEMVMNAVGFAEQIVFDASKPDGTPRKVLDVSRLSDLGWRAATPLPQGLTHAYADFTRVAH